MQFVDADGCPAQRECRDEGTQIAAPVLKSASQSLRSCGARCGGLSVFSAGAMSSLNTVHRQPQYIARRCDAGYWKSGFGREAAVALLNDDRLFPADETTRKIARRLIRRYTRTTNR